MGPCSMLLSLFHYVASPRLALCTHDIGVASAPVLSTATGFVRPQPDRNLDDALPLAATAEKWKNKDKVGSGRVGLNGGGGDKHLLCYYV